MNPLGRIARGLRPCKPQPLAGKPRWVLHSVCGDTHEAPANFDSASAFAGIISLALLPREELDFRVLLDLEEAARFDQEAIQPLGLSPAAFNLPPDEQ